MRLPIQRLDPAATIPTRAHAGDAGLDLTAPNMTQDQQITIHHDDCLTALRAMPDASVSAIVTDPPYGLSNTDPGSVADTITKWATGDREHVPTGRGFMGKAWDAFVPPPAVWDECLRVLKPGGHMVVFAGSRTQDLMGLSIRLAGFDIRDSVAWLYGSGFPKSMNVAKAITGHELGFGSNSGEIRRATMGDEYTPSGVRGNRDGVTHRSDTGMAGRDLPLSEGATQWEGWGTALKPAHEPVIVARKPLSGTVAANVQEHGAGALNIDGCRVPTVDKLSGGHASAGQQMSDGWRRPWMDDPDAVKANVERSRASVAKSESLGRWPANVVLDESQAAELDRQAPDTGGAGKASGPTLRGKTNAGAAFGARNGLTGDPAFYGDRGGASRFFYTAKAPKSERPVVDGTAHPTVKPLAIMRWLIRLTTPPGGLVLDPFAGSGTTIEAAILEGFPVIGIEREADYLPLIQARIDRATAPTPETEPSLFDGNIA